jgi:hypothetical protein
MHRSEFLRSEKLDREAAAAAAAEGRDSLSTDWARRQPTIFTQIFGLCYSRDKKHVDYTHSVYSESR